MSKSRLLYIDNLRTVMIVMVVLVHLSVTYGGEGSWYYKEGRADTVTTVVLTLHNGASQSFFMGLLFLLSAYFTVASFDRKGPGPFLRDRFLRLGIPLLCFEFLIHPFVICVLVKAGFIDLGRPLRDCIMSYYTSFHLGSGPLWFVETLLIFSILYTAWRALHKTVPAASHGASDLPGPSAFVAMGILLGVLSFAVRIKCTVNWSLQPLNLQLAFFVQYVAMFIIGVMAYRRNWLQRLPVRSAVFCFALAGFLVVVVLPLLSVVGGGLDGQVWRYLGGPHWQALAYALWEQLFAVAMIVGLIVLFRERFNRQGRLSQSAAASSYTAYIIHTPIIILFALAMRSLPLYPLLKFAVAALVTIPVTFALASLLRQLPLARRIL
ncbi:MAG: acyltransferase family protein [Sedimentisphaerales bacterium]|nr:acyltransferase family protein [Sedimentisphaerales bacterium]